MTSVLHLPRLLLVLLIRAYQRTIGRVLPQRCRFHPTCSEYAAQAVSELGLIQGGGAAVWRVLRCGPWTAGGVDPVRRGSGAVEASNV